MDFLNFKENIFNNAEYCKDIVYSFLAPFTPNLFMLVAKYGSRTVRGVKNQNMHEVVFVPEKVLLESGFYAFVETLGGSCFKNNEYATDIILPTSIEYFNEGQFEGCSNLKRITISKAINKILANCFALCSKLEDVYYQGSDKEWEDVLI